MSKLPLPYACADSLPSGFACAPMAGKALGPLELVVSGSAEAEGRRAVELLDPEAETVPFRTSADITFADGDDEVDDGFQVVVGCQVVVGVGDQVVVGAGFQVVVGLGFQVVVGLLSPPPPPPPPPEPSFSDQVFQRSA